MRRLLFALPLLLAGCLYVVPDPGPGPDPSPVPIAETGLRALFVYEATGSDTTPAVLSAMFSGKVEGYLNDRCAKDASGRPEWRRSDKDNPHDLDSPLWKKVWDEQVVPRVKTLDDVPLLLVSNGKAGTVYKFRGDETADAVVAVLSKYAGK
jgi:hypothetical protein